MTGISKDQINLSKIIYLDKKGHFIKTKEINNKGINTLINYSGNFSLEKNNFLIPNFYLEDSIFKLYFGVYNPKLFKLVFDDFPNSRIYEIIL